LGQYSKALEQARLSIELEPNNVIPYLNLAQSYIALNDLEDARIAFNHARARKLDAWFLHVGLYELAFLEGDARAMQTEADWAAGKPEAESWMASLQADTAAYSGRLQNARELSRRAVESAKHERAIENAAVLMLDAALREAEFGNRPDARHSAKAALDMADSKDIRTIAALALARAGDIFNAQSLIDRLSKDYPSNTLLNYYWLPTIRAAIELDHGNPDRAIELLKAASPYEMGSAPPLPQGTMYPVYLRGQAYLLARQGKLAAGEFQRILEHRGIVQNCALGALARLGLARAYALQGDAAQARTAYLEFLALWKDADPNLPLLHAANAEYQKLS
jgi:predicted Zn-dependent protease